MNTGTPTTYTWTVKLTDGTTETIDAVEPVDSTTGWTRFRDATDGYPLQVRTASITAVRRGTPVTDPVAPGGTAPGEG